MRISQLDEIAMFGQTKESAIRAGICNECKKQARWLCITKQGLDDYYLHGVCELCVSKLFGEAVH